MGLIERLTSWLRGRSSEGQREYYSLFSAAEAGDAKAVKKLLSKSEDVNKGEWDGRRPLHAAAAGRHTSCVGLLLDQSADINANSWMGTALHCAIENDDMKMVRLLLERGANPNIVSHTTGKRFAGSPPLVLATRKGQKDIVELLLAHGGDPNITSGTDGVLPIDATEDDTIKDLLRRVAADRAAEQQKEAKVSAAKYNEDGTFWDAVPEKLGDERDALTRLLAQLPIFSGEQFREFEGSVERNDEYFQELGRADQAVDWIAAEIAQIAGDVQRLLLQVTKIRVSCGPSTWMSGLLSITLHRTFSSVPPSFQWMAMYSPGTDTKTVAYIARKSGNEYAARYMSASNAASE